MSAETRRAAVGLAERLLCNCRARHPIDGEPHAPGCAGNEFGSAVTDALQALMDDRERLLAVIKDYIEASPPPPIIIKAAETPVPEGFALVPLKPTMAMSIMGQCAIWANPTVDGGGINLQADCCYRAMIEAASLPPIQETKGK